MELQVLTPTSDEVMKDISPGVDVPVVRHAQRKLHFPSLGISPKKQWTMRAEYEGLVIPSPSNYLLVPTNSEGCYWLMDNKNLEMVSLMECTKTTWRIFLVSLRKEPIHLLLQDDLQLTVETLSVVITDKLETKYPSNNYKAGLIH